MPMPISFLNNIYRYVVFARIRGEYTVYSIHTVKSGVGLVLVSRLSSLICVSVVMKLMSVVITAVSLPASTVVVQ